MNQTQKKIMEEMEANKERGHTFAIQAELIDRCSKGAKGAPKEIVHRELSELIRKKKLAQEGERIYLPQTKEHEDLAAAGLAKILSAAPLPSMQIPEKLTAGGISLTREQRNAVSFALNHRISLILGGAGCGKSTVIQAIVQSFPKEEGSVFLCSPTGRAVANLRERTNIQSATTIHAALWRTLEDKQKIFDKLLVIDEISLVSLEMLAWVLTSIRPDCRLVLVGDPGQLRSVACGDVVNDLLKLKVPCIRLKTCHRQSDHESALARNIRNFGYCRGKDDFSFDGSFCFTQLKYDSQIREVVCSLAEESYRKGENVQLLTPFAKKNILAAPILNTAIQNALIPDEEMEKYELRNGDRVQVIANDKNQNVFNGQTGTLRFIWTGDEEPQYQFICGDRSAVYDTRNVMSYLGLAYAMTVHKSQGSEFDTVIIPIGRNRAHFLDRNFFYTAISRAKKKVILVGDPKVLDAILKTKPAPRNSALVEKTNALRYRGTAA